MSSTVLLFISALVLSASVQAAKDHDKHVKSEKHASCQEFTRGLTFNDSQALGTWHLLHYKTETEKGSGDSKCIEFSYVTDEERKNLSELIGKYVENLNWEKITLKMQIPCMSANTDTLKETREYYLERLEGDGSYRSMQAPPPTAKLDLTGFNRYPMRLKMIEGQYLGMMDCHEKFVFLLGKKPAQDAEADARLKKMTDNFWPEER